MAKGFTRRALIGAAVVGLGSAVGYAAARIRAPGDVPASPPTPEPVPKAAATLTPTPLPASPTATPQAVPAPDLARLQDAGTVFERARFAAGQEIDWSTGIFFLDVASGAVEALRLGPGVADPDSVSFYTPLCSGALVHAATTVKRQQREFLISRRTGQTWTWPENAMTALRLGPYVHFVTTRENTGKPVTGILADSSLQEVQRVTFDLAQGYAVDERKGDLYTLTSTGGQVMIHREPLPGGQPVLNYTIEPPKGDRYILRNTADGNGLLAIDGSEGALSGWVLPFGRALLPLPQDLTAGTPVAISTDGLLAYESLIHPVTWNGEGAIVGWPAVVIASAESGEPMYRVRSAAMYYPGQGFTRRWTADGKALAIEVRAEPLPGEFMGRGYAVLDTQLTRVSSLPVVAPTARFPSGYHAPAIPSPWDANLFSLGKTAVVNLFSGTSHTARMPATFSTTDLDPWSSSPFEIVFTGPQLGRGARGPWPYLPAVIEHAPFDDSMRFLARGTAAERRLFDSPEPGARVMRTLPEGEPLDLSVDLSRGDQQDASLDFRIEAGAGVMRVFVRAAGGTAGWVAIEGLEWNLAEVATTNSNTPIPAFA